VVRAALQTAGLSRPHAQIVQRAETLLCLQPQEDRIVLQRVMQVRLHVPGIGDQHTVRREAVDELAQLALDRRQPPLVLGERNQMDRKGAVRFHFADPPAGVTWGDQPHVVSGAPQRRGQFHRVNDSPAGRGPVEQEADDRDFCP